MAPAIAEPEIAADTRPPAVGHYGYVELTLEELRPSPLNPRKHFDKQKLDELAASMANGVGVLEPLVVRPVGDERYEIVAGERRFKAAKQAGLAWVPAVVKALTDAQVVDLMLIENNQRDDLNALEEATGFKTSVKFGITPEDVAHRIGKSAKYVYDRIKLLELIPEAKEHLLAERITAGHAILIARLKPEAQKRIVDIDGPLFEGESDGFVFEDEAERAKREKADPFHGTKAKSVRELEDWIANHIRFDVKQMAAAAPLDFGQTAQVVAAAEAKPGRGKKVVAITFDHFVNPDARTDERTYGPKSFRFADGEKHTDSYPRRTYVAARCEHAVLGVVAAGNEFYGRTFEICIARDKCRVHWKKEIAAREHTEKARDSGKPTDRQKQLERQQAEERRRKAEEQREDAHRKQWKKAAPDIYAAVVERMKSAPLAMCIELVAAEFRDAKTIKDAAVALFKREPKTAEEALRVFALVQASGGIFNEYWGSREYPARAKKLGVDVAPILKKHASDGVQPSAEPATKKAAKKR